MLGPEKSATLAAITDYAPEMATLNGAFATYNNGSTAQAMWMQGALGSAQVAGVLQTFHVPMTTETVNGIATAYARFSNTTSVCAYYSGGWTKITYSNNSLTGNCVSVVNSTIVPVLNTTIVNELKANPTIQNYTSKLYYVNSSSLGSVLSTSNLSFGSSNIFSNSGKFFIASVQKFNAPMAKPKNLTCYGLTYAFNTTSVCSIVVPSPDSPSTSTYKLVNTTEITPDYMISLFSLVNSSTLISPTTTAHT